MAAYLPYQQMAQGAGGSAPSPQPQQPAPQGGGILDTISGILSHPAVQGLLGAYFGAVSSPRQMGVGGAIGRGGLAGLETMGEAQKLRQQLPLTQMKVQQVQAAIPEMQARGKYYDAQSKSLAPIGPEAAGRIAQQNPDFAQLMGPDNLATQTWPEISKMFDDFQKRQLEAPKIKAQTEAAGATAELRKGQRGALPSLIAQRTAATNALNKGMSMADAMNPGGMGAPPEAAPATSVQPAEPAAPPPEATGEATHEQDFVGPDGKKVTMRLIGGKWQPAT